MSDSRPNILWISLEDTTPRFGCYGDPLARTPNLDRLASEGVRFPNAFSTAGVCAPSRCAVITGMYAPSIGGHHMRTGHTNRATPEMPTPYEAVPPPYVKCFTEYLRAAGYYCTNNQKTDYQFKPPATAWDENGGNGHWRNRPDGAPFFAVFNPTGTHESGMWDRSKGSEGPPPTETDPDAVEMPPYLPNTLKARQALARQYDNIAASDRIVGRILNELEEDGLADNTAVFIWSDHGEGLPRGKRWPYDAGIRIPCIVRWPGRLAEGAVSERLVSMIDLGPTVLSMAGVPIPRHMQGQPFLEGEEREYIYAARDRHDESYDMVRAVRDRRFKYLRNFYPELPYLMWIPYRNRHPVMQEMWRLHAEDALEGDQRLMFEPRTPEELYDTESDPYEMRNLAGDPAYAETLTRMRAELERWQREIGDLGHVPEDQMAARFRPDGSQRQAAAPVLAPIAPGYPGRETSKGGSYAAPCLIQLHCATQGASIAYTTEEGGDARWRLYTEPIRLKKGVSTVRAKACRIGYQESAESRAEFQVE